MDGTDRWIVGRIPQVSMVSLLRFLVVPSPRSSSSRCDSHGLTLPSTTTVVHNNDDSENT